MTDIKKWYADTVGGATINAVADRAGVIQSTLNRQLKAGNLTPEMVVAIARAYGEDVLDALVILGLIDDDDIRAHGVRAALRDALDFEVAAEVAKRLGGGSLVFDVPLG